MWIRKTRLLTEPASPSSRSADHQGIIRDSYSRNEEPCEFICELKFAAVAPIGTLSPRADLLRSSPSEPGNQGNGIPGFRRLKRIKFIGFWPIRSIKDASK
jgi:hypothetical protein